MVTYAGLTVVGGTVITSVWGNMVRDATIVPFANASDRTTAIAAPNAAQMTYRTDVKWFEYYDSAATSWVPVPGTIIARANRTTDSSTTTTEIGVLRLDSIPIINGFSYQITTNSIQVQSTTGDIVGIRFRGNTAGAATTASTELAYEARNTTNSSYPYSMVTTVIYNSATTGNLSVLLSVERTNGTGNTKVYGASSFWVTMLGPTPADTGTDI